MSALCGIMAAPWGITRRDWEEIMKHRRLGKKYICLLSACVAVLLIACTVWFYKCQAPTALRIKKYIKYDLLNIPTDTERKETVGLSEGWTSQLYIDGTAVDTDKIDTGADNKRVYRQDNLTRLVNYADGYLLDFPGNTSFDFSRSSAVVVGTGSDYMYTVSTEYCPYSEPHEEMTEGLSRIAPWYAWEDGVDQYIGYYQCRFLWDEGWQQENQVSVTRPEYFQVADYNGFIFHATINGMLGDNYDAYSYVYVHLDGQDFLRIVVKYHRDDTEFADNILSYIMSFQTIERVGSASLSADYYPAKVTAWSEETAGLYDNICNSEELKWGIYTDDIYGEGIETTVPRLEQELNYTFRTILSYIHYGTDFPTDFMKENWDKGRIVELTYQLTTNNNEDMFAYSPMLDIYRGKGLEPLRAFARQAKEFGHPFLFRFCNEMNSDWTSYGGVVNMADPDLFISVYRTVYQIFEEEGVDNCIWIYNPNDRNAPPNKWNDALNYYPGNDYVQMIGVTGYNNGTYYTQWSEEWREFDEIYDHIAQLYTEPFGRFPWMITEFSSSSVGGDKVAWIDNMFQTISNYPNIKIAVWFDSADWDSEGNVARPYWLDETQETTAAFRRGLAAYGDSPWVGS